MREGNDREEQRRELDTALSSLVRSRGKRSQVIRIQNRVGVNQCNKVPVVGGNAPDRLSPVMRRDNRSNKFRVGDISRRLKLCNVGWTPW